VSIVSEGQDHSYDVQDPFGDDGMGPGEIYRTASSCILPIPRPGTRQGDYEAGTGVLALYPETTTFYKATVKNALEGGTKVQLMFAGEVSKSCKVVERRLVLAPEG
jgi:SAGA-associated factor 29